MFKRILVAVDGSPASTAGLHSAVDLAMDQQATLLALHVIDDGSLPINFEGAAYPTSYIDAYFEALDKLGRQVLDQALKLARGRGVKIDGVLVRSRGHSVAQVIVKQSLKLKADVIVLGTHGRRGLKRILMGSDAEEVVREASVPVLLVRGRQKRSRTRPAQAEGHAPAKVRRSAGKSQPKAPAR